MSEADESMSSHKGKKWVADLLRTSLGGDDRTREAARESLKRYGSSILPDLIALTRSVDPTLRWTAVDSLGTLGDPRATSSVLERALTDTDVHARWRSIWALRRLDGGECVPVLLDALVTGNGPVAWNAAVVLSVYSRTEAIDTLIRGLEDEDAFMRWEAASGLGSIRDERAVPALAAALHKDDVDLRKEVALSLGKTGGRRAAIALVDALEQDKSPEVRWRAAMAMGWTNDRRNMEALRRVLGKEKNPHVRKEIREAIRALKEGE